MSTVKIIKNTVDIKVKEISAKDGQIEYRYILIKEWGEADKKVTVVMYNPSNASYLMYDKTVMNVENFLKKKGFNKINIVNLYAIKSEKSSIVRKRNLEYEKLNDTYIKKAIEDSEVVILAWGYGKENKDKNPKYVLDRIKQVEKMVEVYAKNNKVEVKHFINENKIPRCHPQNMNYKTWDYEEYIF